jgi:hypothetical protein
LLGVQAVDSADSPFPEVQRSSTPPPAREGASPSPTLKPAPRRGGEDLRTSPTVERAVAPPLPGEGSAGGRGGRGVRVSALESAEPIAAPARSQELSAAPLERSRLDSAEPAPLRPARREAPAPPAELPTVEGSRAAPLPEPVSPDAEASETVVQVSIGRIDVRATPPSPPASGRRAERQARAGLSLADYLRRRGEGRR